MDWVLFFINTHLMVNVQAILILALIFARIYLEQ
jgi:hypothetical protein